MSRKMGVSVVAMVAVMLFAIPASGAVTRVAGQEDKAGFGGDGGSPASSLLNTPSGVDEAGGNLYIADTVNNRIRVVATGEGTITIAPGSNEPVRQGGGAQNIKTLAGDGTAGFANVASLNNAEAVVPLENARFSQPMAVGACTTASYDVVYVADSGNHVIRRILLPKVAGPLTVSTDTDNLTVTIGEGGNRPVVTTIVGTGKAGFTPAGGSGTNTMLNRPMGITCGLKDSDRTGLFRGQTIRVADTDNHRVLQFDVSPVGEVAAVSLRAGTGTAGFSGDGGAGEDAQLRSPRGMHNCNNSGGLVIADTGNNRIRLIRSVYKFPITVGPGGVERQEDEIITVAGTGVPGFSGDGNSALGARLNQPWSVLCDYSRLSGHTLTFADSGNHRVRQVNVIESTTITSGGVISTKPEAVIRTLLGAGVGGGRLENPRQVAGDHDAPYVADALRHVIRKVD